MEESVEPKHGAAALGAGAHRPRQRFSRPRVLLLDIDERLYWSLTGKRFDVSARSLGQPYRFGPISTDLPVDFPKNPPTDIGEKDVIVLDLGVTERSTGSANVLSPLNPRFFDSRQNWVCSGAIGRIDPRPPIMSKVSPLVARALDSGAVLIVFSSPRLLEAYTVQIDPLTSPSRNAVVLSNWQIVDIPALRVNELSGTKLTACPIFVPLDKLLVKHLASATYTCTLDMPPPLRNRWLPLALTPLGDVAAGVLVVGPAGDSVKDERGSLPAPLGSPERGLVFILPQVKDKVTFLSELLSEVLPEISPHLYPELVQTRWIHESAYDFPEVSDLKRQIAEIQESAETEIAIRRKAIEEENARVSFMNRLLTDTGDSLKLAVKESLGVLGFSTVIDKDEEIRETGLKGANAEDLQIHEEGRSLLLIEVKGITGTVADYEALQVFKYLAPRMKELGRVDLCGLSIINHERTKVPLLRTRCPFNQNAIDTAESSGIGLMTALDLYRLLRSFRRNHWDREATKAVFYRTGVIEPKPSSYEYMGRIEDFLPDLGVVGVRIEEGVLRRQDRIAFELPVEFVEQTVDSLQFEHKDVERVETGHEAGIKTDLQKREARKGVRVFRVTPRQDEVVGKGLDL
jgi:hypothetical protein